MGENDAATPRGARTLELFAAAKAADATRVQELVASDPGLVFAIGERDVRWVRRLLSRRAALAWATDLGGKPLAPHATECGNEEIAHLFREHGAAPPAEQDDESA